MAYLGFAPKAEYSPKISEAIQIQTTEAERAPFKTIAWYKADKSKSIKASKDTALGKFMSYWTKTPGKWKSNPQDAFIRSDAQAAEMNEKARPAYEKAAIALTTATMAEEAAAASFHNQVLNDTAETKISDWRDAESDASAAKGKQQSV